MALAFELKQLSENERRREYTSVLYTREPYS